MRESWKNFWRSDMPFAERVATAMRNNAKKMRTRQGCCGNHGDPGC
jgi:hypothetical protein